MSQSKILQIIPAHDWFFVHDGQHEAQPVAHRIAAWRLDDSGNTVGLIGGVQTGPDTHSVINKLVAVPPVKGVYKHLDDLNPNELKSAKKK